MKLIGTHQLGAQVEQGRAFQKTSFQNTLQDPPAPLQSVENGWCVVLHCHISCPNSVKHLCSHVEALLLLQTVIAFLS